MDVSEKAGKKTLTQGELSSTEWKKDFSMIYSTLLFCIKKSSVQQSPKFEWINKQLNELIGRGCFLLSVSPDRIEAPMIYLYIMIYISKGANDLSIDKTNFVKS